MIWSLCEETMNYYAARQRLKDQRWDYTLNDRPYGYCREYVDPDQYPESIREYMTENEVQKTRAFQHKYHRDGHATEQEACDCYKEYMLDHHLQLDREDCNSQHKCQKCGEW